MVKVCGTNEAIKGEAANVSVRFTIGNQIITLEDLYCWTKNNIKGVTLIYVPSIEINEHERKFELKSQFSSVPIVDGTRSYHCFIPQSKGCLIMKCVYIDCHYDKHEFFCLDLQNGYSQYKPRKYVACFNDGTWHIGIILDCSYQNQD